jgi:hypothetical protein
MALRIQTLAAALVFTRTGKKSALLKSVIS